MVAVLTDRLFVGSDLAESEKDEEGHDLVPFGHVPPNAPVDEQP